MKTLHELSQKLKKFIIESQLDAHNVSGIRMERYNNLKLRMDTKYHYPNIIVSIGISEATYNFQEGTKTAGSLGPDEKYIRKWLMSRYVLSDLKEIWLAMGDLIKAENEDENDFDSMDEKESVEYYMQKRKQRFKDALAAAMPTNGEIKAVEEEDTEEVALSFRARAFRNFAKKKEMNQEQISTVERFKNGLQNLLFGMFGKK